MTYELAYRRLEGFVGRTFMIYGHNEFVRPFIITEVTERIVRCRNEVEDFNMTRIRMACLLMAGQLRDHQPKTT